MDDLFLFLDENPNQTQETSHVVEQNVDLEMAGLDIGSEGVFGTVSSPSGTITMDDLFLYLDENPNQTQEISPIGEQNVEKEMVGLDIGKSSRNKHKKLRSDVWKNFEKYKDEDGNDLAKCNLCEKLFNGSSKKGTTHLRNHLISCQKKRNEGGASGSGDKPAGNSVTDQQLNRLDRVKMLIKQCNWKQIGNADIIDLYNEEKEKLRMYFEKHCCRCSLAINNVADGKYKYAYFIVNFIDDDWMLANKYIGFKCMEGDQYMKVLKNMLSDFGIDNKIFSMITFGDSDIYVLSSDEREKRLSSQGSLLSDGNFVDTEITCSGFGDETVEVLNHVSNILNYIRETSLKNGTFQIAIDKARSLGKEVTAEDIPTEEELEDMIGLELVKIALGLKEAFFELENMDPDFKPINLTKEEWDVITTFYPSWDEFYEIYYKTANMYFLWVCRMYKEFLALVTLNSFNCGKIYLQFVRDAEKCWDQSNLNLAVAAVLDPRFKMDIVEHWYKEIYGDECETKLAEFMDYLTGVYNKYAEGTNNFQSSTSGSKEKESSISLRMLDVSGYSSHDTDSGQSLNSELHLYLKYVNFPLFEDFNILEWWQGYSWYSPTLAKMARDFLSIEVAFPYDYMFWVCPPSHKHFDSKIVKEALVCTENWLRDEEDK